jgi:hypothetical protein
MVVLVTLRSMKGENHATLVNMIHKLIYAIVII